MFVLKSDYNAVVQDNENLQKQIEELKSKVQDLKFLLNKAYSDELEECDFEFDFKSTGAFSIERINKNSKNQTVIGYTKDDENTIGEWYLSCSFAQHQKLAEQFRKSVLKK